jgi:hypothetical protein
VTVCAVCGRAFLHQREQLRCDATLPNVPPVAAFFGFRHRRGDHLYAHELAELQRANQPLAFRPADASPAQEGPGADERDPDALLTDPDAPASAARSWWPDVAGGLSIYTAFSRDKAGAGGVGRAGGARAKEYVQTCIAREGKSVWRLLCEGAVVYVAGAAGAMPQVSPLSVYVPPCRVVPTLCGEVVGVWPRDGGGRGAQGQ